MAIYTYPFDDRYQVLGNTDAISVSVVIGNGQGGSYSIYKNEIFLSANEPAQLGDGNSCRGNKLRVSSTIQDKLAQTNWTSVTVVITENGRSTTYSYAKELPADLDIARYKITIQLI